MLDEASLATPKHDENGAARIGAQEFLRQFELAMSVYILELKQIGETQTERQRLALRTYLDKATLAVSSGLGQVNGEEYSWLMAAIEKQDPEEIKAARNAYTDVLRRLQATVTDVNSAARHEYLNENTRLWTSADSDLKAAYKKYVESISHAFENLDHDDLPPEILAALGSNVITVAAYAANLTQALQITSMALSSEAMKV
jgi:hypothetical protein